MLFGFLFQQFYNMVDTIIVGKCLGVSALAAVGSTGSINFMIIGSAPRMQRLRDSGRAEIWSRRLCGNAQVRSKRRMAVRSIRSSYDHHRRLPLHGYFAVDEHAGRYHPGGL